MPAISTETTTHASRNPTKRVQLSRTIGRRARGHPRGPLTDSEKASRALKAANRKRDEKLLNNYVDEFFDLKAKFIAEIVKSHGHTEEYAKRLLNNGTQYKSKREVNLRNALVHDLHLKARERGETISLKDLGRVADEKQLVEYRQLKRVGLRANNLAAGADSRATVSHIQQELMDLYECTGTYGVALFSRGNIDDAFIPAYAESGGAFAFFLRSLKIAGLDVLRLFEQWCCVQDRAPERDSIKALKNEITKVITDGLNRMIKRKGVKMSYSKYETDIKMAWKVKIMNWPANIPFVRPSLLGTNDRVRRICSLVRSGEIHWEYMDLEEIRELEADLEHRREEGTLNTRKTRADKGKKHKRRAADDDDNDDDEEEGEEGRDDDENDEDNDESPSSSVPASTSALPPSSTPHLPSTGSFEDLFDYSFDYSNVPTIEALAAEVIVADALTAGLGQGSGAPFPPSTGLPALSADGLFPSGPFPLSVDGLFPSGPFPLSADGPLPGALFFPPPTGLNTATNMLTHTVASAVNTSTTVGGVQFRAPATPATLAAAVTNGKRKRGAADGAEPAKKKVCGPAATTSASSAPKKPRKTRSDKGTTREKGAAAKAARENVTPEELQWRQKRIAAKKSEFCEEFCE
ncbi:hypothetical protein B0H19DRAFT_1276185 [Mycena capillaripes]|nr:hypothetical protein B0H19DRAFT_1276185 [Mycena capillaripes]